MNVGLKDAWSDSFKIGAAVSKSVLTQKESDEILKKHFSSITAENCMKFGSLKPEKDQYYWDETDFLVNYAKKNNISIRGHTILWHNQYPKWLFLDGNKEVSKKELFKRLEEHIISVTTRYKDTIKTWDVLNEVIDTDGGDENGMRLSNWYKIGTNEIYKFAFKKMREVCPDAKLYYNDYNNESGKKLEKTLQFLSSMLDEGIPIDGVGVQGHWYFNFPDEKTIRAALEKYSALGLDIELTEVDISIYEWSEAREKHQFLNAPPPDRLIEQGKRYLEIFKLASGYPAVKNITTWGVADNHTWLDGFPVKNRKNWPLLFDVNCNEKPIVAQLIEAGITRKK